eukprot:693972-Prymnesium_polylepis.2
MGGRRIEVASPSCRAGESSSCAGRFAARRVDVWWECRTCRMSCGAQYSHVTSTKLGRFRI